MSINSFAVDPATLPSSGGEVTFTWDITADFHVVTSSPTLPDLPTNSGDTLEIPKNTDSIIDTYIFTLTTYDSLGTELDSEDVEVYVAALSPIKMLRFRLIDASGSPITFADISAKLTPVLTNSRNANTVFPTTLSTQTNQYGFAQLKLYANDVLQTDSKYLIKITYNGKNYFFLIQLEESMNNVLDFEDIINRSALEELRKCNEVKEGQVRIRGSRYFY